MYHTDYSSFTLHAEKRLNERSHNTFYSIFINRKNNKYISKTSTVYNAVFYNEMNHLCDKNTQQKYDLYLWRNAVYNVIALIAVDHWTLHARAHPRERTRDRCH